MIPIRRGLILCILLGCLGVLSAGCANFLQPETGAVARKEARIALAKDIPAGTWETGQLRLAYTLSATGDAISLVGKATIDRSVTYSFPVVLKFFLYVSFLDGEGRVLETVDVSPVINTYGGISDNLEVKLSHARPPGAEAIAFHYYGVFKYNSEDSGDTWEIYHFPFN